VRGRLAEIDEQLVRLRRMHECEGDAFAGRLIGALERERAEILVKISAST